MHFHLFGFPIAHSAAPAFHNECFNNLGLPQNHFNIWPTSKITDEMLEEIRSDESGGAAITMPLKTEILQHLDELTPAARATGACNTIVKVKRKDGTYKLVGTNTDVLGVRNALLRTLRAQHPSYAFRGDQRFPSGAASALVIGGGATTRSAVYALSTLRLNPIFLVNRDEEEVRSVIESFAASSKSNGYPELIHLRSIDVVDKYFGASMTEGGEQRTPPLTIIVGAIPAIAPTTSSERLVYTTVMHILTLPYIPLLSTPLDPISSQLPTLPLPLCPIFLDMAYKPRLTPFLRIAGALNWITIGGVQAMIEQGLAQQRMWLVEDVSDEVAAGDGPSGSVLGEEVERMAREMVEGMQDIAVSESEVDRALMRQV